MVVKRPLYLQLFLSVLYLDHTLNVKFFNCHYISAGVFARSPGKYKTEKYIPAIYLLFRYLSGSMASKESEQSKYTKLVHKIFYKSIIW